MEYHQIKKIEKYFSGLIIMAVGIILFSLGFFNFLYSFVIETLTNVNQIPEIKGIIKLHIIVSTFFTCTGLSLFIKGYLRKKKHSH